VTAGPAVLHDSIALELAAADDLPCADSAFLVPLKRSHEFRDLRPRLAGRAPHPVLDSWLDDGFHFFMFGLARDGGVAVFAMHPESPTPISAVAVTPAERKGWAEITNLQWPGGSYIAPLPAQAQSTAVVPPPTQD
jgi:hypothetical protein